jgi:hypothetical protein
MFPQGGLHFENEGFSPKRPQNDKNLKLILVQEMDSS